MKVCILAAGLGTRISAFGGKLHKGLLPLANMAVISHIIKQFPLGTSYVIALGYIGEQVRDYIRIAHPDLPVTFVEVEPYQGPGSGPGQSLWCCRDFLNEPFYLTACDTLVTTPIPPLDGNFMATQPVDDPALWCTVETDDKNQIQRLYYKSATGTQLGFIGFAGIYNHNVFWEGLAATGRSESEFQVNDGFAALIHCGLRAVPMGWIDTGTDENYQRALEKFSKNYTFYGKTTDVTYRLGDLIIKFFSNTAVTQRRFQRGYNNPTFAKTENYVGNFFSYHFAKGRMLSTILTGPHCLSALQWIQKHFWSTCDVAPDAFEAACRKFYGTKTLARLDDYLRLFAADGESDELIINGIPCRSVRQSVADLSPDFWCGGLPSTFHGDLHDDNIVVGDDGALTLIDWREDFAGMPDGGDRYYDFAKFYHTLDLSVEVMDAGGYWVKPQNDGVIINHTDRLHAPAARDAFWKFIQVNGYNRQRVELINGLIFINMAPLYAQSMADYLYHLGRLRLEQALQMTAPSQP